MRRVAAWSAWFGGLLVFWLLLVGTLQDVEVIAGICAAAIGATAAEVVRSQGLLRYRVEGRWIGPGAKQLVRVVPDFVRLMVALPRRPRGVFRTVRFPSGGERDVDRGRRAWAALTASLPPTRVVVDFDPAGGRALVHDLPAQAGSDELLG